jgi:hypothetical protein
MVVVTSYTRIHKLEICLSIRDDYIDESGHWCVCVCVCVLYTKKNPSPRSSSLWPMWSDRANYRWPTTGTQPALLCFNIIFIAIIHFHFLTGINNNNNQSGNRMEIRTSHYENSKYIQEKKKPKFFYLLREI